MPVAHENLIRLQRQPELIRNICILAHVDHGKTSLSDCLLATNGIISQNLQGKIRYLDSRPDEQTRGITMESSAISLYFRVAKRAESDAAPTIKEYLINLIDSPGHIDFSSEVSTASRLCDGSVVLVDVVEGVCSQTVTVLRQSWVEKLKPILVLNKMDRLITDLQLTPMEAYRHITKLIEQINAVVGSFFAGQRMEDDLKWRELVENDASNEQKEFVEASDEEIYFAPEKNNVVFGSAIDGWGFNISQFAAIYERKLGIKREKLEKVLWGEFYFDPKSKKVIPGSSSSLLKGRNYRPLFVQLVLENIWAIYDSTMLNKNTEKVTKIINALELKVLPRDITSKDSRSLLTTIFNQWIPISRSILLSVIDIIPSPIQAQKERMNSVLENTPGYQNIPKPLSDSMTNCDRNGNLAAFISKVITIRKKDLPTKRGGGQQTAEERISELRNKSRQTRELSEGASNPVSSFDSLSLDENNAADNANDEDNKEVIIGFARVFGGTLKTNQSVYLLGPRYNPSHPKEHCTEATITALYILMGRDLILIDEAPAGSIVGVGGLDGKILKSGTIVDIPNGGPNLASSNGIAPPILRVAVEPVNPSKLPQLEQGLKLLNASDPCVQVSIQENGEHILATAGELHLERCIKDLQERFAKIEVHYSKPVVPFRETIVEDKDWKPKNGNPRGYSETTVGSITLKLQVFPLPTEISDFITNNVNELKAIVEKNKNVISESLGLAQSREATPGPEFEEEDSSNIVVKDSELQTIEAQLHHKIENNKSIHRWVKDPVSTIVSFAPRKTGSNILFDETGTFSRLPFSSSSTRRTKSPYEDDILTGFHLAVSQGQLCGEPVHGIGCIITEISNSQDEQIDSSLRRRIISATRQSIYESLSDWSPRLMLATYLCDIQATTEVLGKVYGVITKRKGKIITEEMKEGTPFFTVHASIPVVEAFGCSEEMRKKTSGAANPQLIFNGFEIFDQDPFWVPTTEEELEDLGELADKENIALSYVTSIRKRKGLPVHQKVVDNAERQRTLKK